tara:strand:+ start:153 stop:308 length:156 start_codon:yes stop_codon:yes gene_type:complete
MPRVIYNFPSNTLAQDAIVTVNALTNAGLPGGAFETGFKTQPIQPRNLDTF